MPPAKTRPKHSFLDKNSSPARIPLRSHHDQFILGNGWDPLDDFGRLLIECQVARDVGFGLGLGIWFRFRGYS